MSLRDVVSGAGLSNYAVWALILFGVSFTAVFVWIITRPRKEIDRQSRIPLDDNNGP
ncbi:MAG: CcoQ/FixQ family Cbb3-type cytochrome c oxidase assembly chaperone [Thermomicrobiales bacterium]